MKLRPLLLPGLLLLAGCAAMEGKPSSGCHGARRPANPNGTVLGAPREAPGPAAVQQVPACGARRP